MHESAKIETNSQPDSEKLLVGVERSVQETNEVESVLEGAQPGGRWLSSSNLGRTLVAGAAFLYAHGVKAQEALPPPLTPEHAEMISKETAIPVSELNTKWVVEIMIPPKKGQPIAIHFRQIHKSPFADAGTGVGEIHSQRSIEEAVRRIAATRSDVRCIYTEGIIDEAQLQVLQTTRGHLRAIKQDLSKGIPPIPEGDDVTALLDYTSRLFERYKLASSVLGFAPFPDLVGPIKELADHIEHVMSAKIGNLKSGRPLSRVEEARLIALSFDYALLGTVKAKHVAARSPADLEDSLRTRFSAPIKLLLEGVIDVCVGEDSGAHGAAMKAMVSARDAAKRVDARTLTLIRSLEDDQGDSGKLYRRIRELLWGSPGESKGEPGEVERLQGALRPMLETIFANDTLLQELKGDYETKRQGAFELAFLPREKGLVARMREDAQKDLDGGKLSSSYLFIYGKAHNFTDAFSMPTNGVNFGYARLMPKVEGN